MITKIRRYVGRAKLKLAVKSLKSLPTSETYCLFSKHLLSIPPEPWQILSRYSQIIQESLCSIMFRMKVKVAQSCLTLCDLMNYTVHGILQARILEWVAFPFSRGSSQPRNQTQVSCIAGRVDKLSHKGSPLIFRKKRQIDKWLFFKRC